MKVSVAIPTHNRLDLLRDAVETVRRQDYQNWEVVIFDNASGDDVARYVAELNDPRIRSARSDIFLPVTDSWNRALSMAGGDYVITIGDDDGLMPGYLSRLASLIATFHNPDLVYAGVLQFFHPGVAPAAPLGFVVDNRYAFFFGQRTEPFLLPDRDALKAISGSVTFRRNFGLGMQSFCFSRRLLDDLRRDGPLFRAPFPDYYLANVAIASSRATLVIPDPMTIQGISKLSFGFALFNEQEERGEALLNAKLHQDPLFDRVSGRLLPGPMYQTNYLLTMTHVVEQLRGKLRLRVAVDRYRRLQMLWAIDRLGVGDWRSGTEAAGLWSRLSLLERLICRALTFLVRRCGKRYPKLSTAIRRHVEPYRFFPQSRFLSDGNYSGVLELFEALRSGRLAVN